MSAQRARSSVATERRSISPRLAGMPWWGAILIAVTATAIGFAFDAGSGDKELTHVFAGLYVLGCLVAVLAVEQSGVFATVVQPPLILFCSVPGAYWVFHGAGFPGIKNALINCGYPLIERFPLMLFTSAAVLAIGVFRWYFGARMDHITAKLAALSKRRRPADEADAAAPTNGSRRRHTAQRPAREAASARSTRKTARTDRPTKTTRTARTGDADRPARATRRSAPEPRRREARPRTDRSARRSYTDTPPPPPPRRRAPAAGNGSDSSHHPISRVRYRSEAGGES